MNVAARFSAGVKKNRGRLSWKDLFLSAPFHKFSRVCAADLNDSEALS